MLENTKNYNAPMHSAEHILNQTMVQKFDCERSFNNHIEKKKSKCDYNFIRNLTKQEIVDIELKVNEIINQNLEITEEFLTYEQAGLKFDLSKLDKETNKTVRIINIGNYDQCVCSGEHVKTTSEIGKFNITTVTHENNFLRIRYKLA